MKLLYPLIKDKRNIFFLGTAKNSGKTVALNRLISESEKCDFAITSIGLDGEIIDKIAFNLKPRIKIKKDNYVINYELITNKENFYIIEDLDIYDAVWHNLLLLKSKKEQLIEIAGPGNKSSMEKIINRLNKKGYKLYIDGALDRKSIIGSRYIDAIFLSIGAVLNRSLEKVIYFYKNLIKSLTFKTFTLNGITKENNDFIFFKENKKMIKLNRNQLTDIKNTQIKGYNLYIKTSITPNIIEKIKTLSIKSLIIDNPSKIFINYTDLVNLSKKIDIFYRYKPEIKAIIVNPYSPYGWQFNEKEFLYKLKEVEPEFRYINILKEEVL